MEIVLYRAVLDIAAYKNISQANIAIYMHDIGT